MTGKAVPAGIRLALDGGQVLREEPSLFVGIKRCLSILLVEV